MCIWEMTVYFFQDFHFLIDYRQCNVLSQCWYVMGAMVISNNLSSFSQEEAMSIQIQLVF